MALLVDGTLCIRDAARELGLPFANNVDPYSSQDVMVLQLLALANAQGQELAREYAWTATQRKVDISITTGITTYDLPPDWLGLMPMTAYGSNQSMALLGSLTPGQWASLSAWTAGPVIGGPFRIQGGVLEVTPGATTQTITLAYRSSWWATNGAGSAKAEELSAETPLHVFDRRLMVCAIKNAFTEAKGFDSTLTKAQYDRALSRAMGSDGTPPTLTVGGVSRNSCLVGPGNLPPSGWGT